MAENDLISRRALIVRLAHHHAHSYGNVERAYGVAVEEVLNVPAVEAEPKWISVKERLPESDGKYIVCTAKESVYCTRFKAYSHSGNFQTDINTHVTHWMPLPKPPKEDV